MSNQNGRNLSASQRQLAAYEEMRQEYTMLLTILINSSPDKMFILHERDAKAAGKPRNIKVVKRIANADEIAKGIPAGRLMEFTFCEEPPEPPRLIVPANS